MKGSATNTLEGLRVLVLEDEFFLADDLAGALRAAGAEPVGPANKISQAEELIGSGRVDAAILDVNLHGEMASEFIGRLAATDVPCLIVSGYGEDALPDSVRRVVRMEKPVSPAAVIASLAKQIDSARPAVRD